MFAYWKFVTKFSESGALLTVPLVGLRGLEPPTLRLSGVRSNHLSYKPMSIKALVVGNYLRPNSRPARRRHWSFLCFLSFSKERKWWRWGESNSWPPACKAGALPAELHPRFEQGSEVIPSLFSPFLKVQVLSQKGQSLHSLRLWPLLKLSLPSFFLERKKVVPSKLNNDLLIRPVDLRLWTYLSRFMSP